MASDTRAERRRHGARHGRFAARPIAVRPGRQRAGIDHVAQAVRATVTTFEEMLPATMAGVTVTIEELPSAAELRAARATAPLGRLRRGNPSTVTVFRVPIEARCTDRAQVNRMVRDALAELVADLAGVSPERVSPDYGT